MGTPATPSGAAPTVAVAVSDPTEGGKYCGAIGRQKGHPYCRQRAGARTPHSGAGRCWLHGGMQQIWCARDRWKPLKIGRVGELIEHFDKDPDPLDTLPDIIAQRSLAAEFMERHAAFTAALLAWHASYQQTQRPFPEDLILAVDRCLTEYEILLRDLNEPTEGQLKDLADTQAFIRLLRAPVAEAKPRVVLDISDASRILDRVSVSVERLKEQQGSIGPAVLKRILEQMARSVRTRVPDPELVAAIRRDWLAIEIPL